MPELLAQHGSRKSHFTEKAKERKEGPAERERREDGREEAVWMTDTVSQWLAGPETLSTWPERLGGV